MKLGKLTFITATFGVILFSSQVFAQSNESLIEQWAQDSLVLHANHSLATCTAWAPGYQYRPKLRACRNKAAIIASGNKKNFFSAQLRKADGSDRLNPKCERNDCSPYKIQKTIKASSAKTVCFGAAGNATVMKVVKYATIKRSVTDHNPLTFCLLDPKQPQN